MTASIGKVSAAALAGNAAAYAPLTTGEVASHSIDWWLTVEDLPDRHNRIRVDGDKIILEYTENNSAAYDDTSVQIDGARSIQIIHTRC